MINSTHKTWTLSLPVWIVLVGMAKKGWLFTPQILTKYGVPLDVELYHWMQFSILIFWEGRGVIHLQGMQ